MSSPKEKILSDLKKALKKLNLPVEDIHIEHPALLEHGDYSSNFALAKFDELKTQNSKLKTPLDLARLIVGKLPQTDYLEKVEVAPPGFINFTLTPKTLITLLAQINKEKENFGKGNIFKGKKILLEHTSPNPQTTIMIGHLRNNFLGMTTARILETLGAKVVKDCIVNDRGVHICKAILGYLVFAKRDFGLSVNELKNFREISDQKVKEIAGKTDWKQSIKKWAEDDSGWLAPENLGIKSDHFNLVFYVLGSRAYSLEKGVKEQIEEILLAWEAEDKYIWDLWKRILKDWSAKGYEETYKRVDSVHDWVWYESELYKAGKKIVMGGLEKGVFRRSKGAIVSDLSKYGLPDTVLIKSDGTALYHTFDLNLTLQKRKKFPSDLYIWDIGVEQTLYLKQLYVMCEQLGFGKLSEYLHLSYNHVNFKGGGKMRTREGTVIPADELLDKLHKKAKKIIETSNQELRGQLGGKGKEDIAEKVGLSAAKYGMLKYGRGTTIYFDIDESLSLEGNSGPYLQYTHARARSVLTKAGRQPFNHLTMQPLVINSEELALLRTLYKFPEIVGEAGKNFAPNLICNFLFDLAQKFNLFYTKWPILKPETRSKKLETRNFRLALTSATAQVLKNGLLLLGIEPLERM